MSDLEVKTFNHGKGKIDLRAKQAICDAAGYEMIEARLDELHLKENAAIGDEPGFALVSTIPMRGFVVSTVSLATLKGAFRELGYILYRPEVKDGAQNDNREEVNDA